MENEREHWRSVPGYEGIYEVSNQGRVRSVERYVAYSNGQIRFWRGKVLKPSITAAGYPAVELCRGGKGKTTNVHSLVAAAFLGPRPAGQQVAHCDGDMINPRLYNLRYATPTENHADKIGHGTMPYGERNGLAKLTALDVVSIRERLSTGESQKALAQEFKITEANVSQIKLRRTWGHL